jgi:hypothetical protein
VVFFRQVRFAVVIDRLVPFPLPHPDADDVVYLLGDSHILPLAWATVDSGHGGLTAGSIDGAAGSARGGGGSAKASGAKKLQFVPRLSIGVKAWHFNVSITGSREREIYLRQAASIPTGSVVVVSAGEIDLRDEGDTLLLHEFPTYHSSACGVR